LERFERLDFNNLDELLRTADRIPEAVSIPLDAYQDLEKSFENSKRFKLVCSGKRIFQVASRFYTVIKHGDVIKSVVSSLAELGLDDMQGDVKTWDYGSRMWITAYTPKEVEPLRGDAYRVGLRFWNSYDGSTSVGAGFGALRMVCSNGMVAWTREMAVTHIHLGIQRVEDWLKDAIKQIREQQTAFEQLIQKAAKLRLQENLEPVLKRIEIGPMVQKKIENRLETSDGLTALDVVNAITWFAAHDLPGKPIAQENYQKLANRILQRPEILVEVPAR